MFKGTNTQPAPLLRQEKDKNLSRALGMLSASHISQLTASYPVKSDPSLSCHCTEQGATGRCSDLQKWRLDIVMVILEKRCHWKRR